MTEYLDHEPEVDEIFHGYLRGDLLNPWRSGTAPSEEMEAWLREFNLPFLDEEAALEPIVLTGDSIAPFDRLDCSPLSNVPEGPLVSVVVTVYKPDNEQLGTSIRSLLNQTWQNLEIIIVDDGSPPEFSAMLDFFADLDPRIQIVRAPANMGTYAARNLGASRATGVFLTGQDSDDWSHPRRVERQVQHLLAHPHAVGCQVFAVTCTPDLVRTRLGYSSPFSLNTSSLMVAREVFEMVGGYLSVRKAADTEIAQRVMGVTSRPIDVIRQPLSIVRILPDSLSRSDFAPGWHHPARRYFKSTVGHWHKSGAELRLARGARSPISVPARFSIDRSVEHSRYDVVYAGDWRQYGGPQRSMIEEIQAVLQEGLRVGILQMEAPRFMSAGDKPLCGAVQQLLNDGLVDPVFYDQHATIDLLILRYPPLLQFDCVDRSSLRVRRMVILANQAPSEKDGADIRYRVTDCDDHARDMFGVEPLWVPQGPLVREAIALDVPDGRLAAFDTPGVLDVRAWWRERRVSWSNVPVVGRHSRDNSMKWPRSAAVLTQVYPVNGTVDVRILGRATVPLARLKRTLPPSSWIVYDTDEMDVAEFLSTLDFYVFYQHPNAVEAFGRSILEGIASGAVTLLPPHFKPVFGDAAVYCEESAVGETVMRYHRDRSLYEHQLERAKSVLRERFSYESYREQVRLMLATPEADWPAISSGEASNNTLWGE